MTTERPATTPHGRGRRRSLSQGNTTLDSIPTTPPAVTPASSYRKIGSRLNKDKSGRKSQLAIEAIHDIDSNLIFANRQYNPNLGKAFKSKQVTRNIFCSDMGQFSKIEVDARCAVRDHYATTYKFETYAIVIPSDYAWHIDSAILAEFFQAGLKINLRNKKPEDLARIDEILTNPRFESIKLLVKPDKSAQEIEQILKAQVDPGTVFEKLEKYHSPELEAKAMHAKWVADIAAFKADLLGVKGLVLRKFFKINETRFCSFVVTDDKQHEIDAIISESKQWPNAIVTGIYTPEKTEACTKKYYTEKLGGESPTRSASDSATSPPPSPLSLKTRTRSVGNNSPEEVFPGISLRTSLPSSSHSK